MDKQHLAGVVYLARKLHWSRGQIRDLTPSQFREILSEVSFQEQQEEYWRNYRVSSLIATIINCTPRKNNRQYKAEDFIGPPPERIDAESPLDVAQKKGLKVPKKEG